MSDLERPVRVLFFTSCLGGGGAEKHAVRVANHLDRSRFRVSVAVARGGGSYEAELAGDVAYHPFPAGRMRSALGPMRRLIGESRPDVVCSFIDHANCVALAAARTMRDAPPVVVGVQVPPSQAMGADSPLSHRLFVGALRTLYPRAARVVALSRGVERELHEMIPRTRRLTRVIHNVGLDASILEQAEAPVEPPHPRDGAPVLMACGRLSPEKGFDRLLRALARVRERVPARLWIVGEGPERAALEAEARRVGVADAVWFGGFDPNPYRWMRAADLFVLSSLYEGFGNVIVEAMAVGTAVVATDCPYGPGEIIGDGVTGLLAAPRDEEALAASILRALEDGELRHALAEAGRVRARDFEASGIAREYGELLEDVARERAPSLRGR